MAAEREVDHLKVARHIMSFDSEDLGDHDIAEATGHAIIAAVDQLAAIVQVLQSREPGMRVTTGRVGDR